MKTNLNTFQISPPNFWVGIRNISDYSPFGVLLKERTVENDFFRTSFQYQEHDDEIKGEGNSVNFKYRMHDPRVGRFFAVDPLSSQFPHNSAYAFSENILINAIELEGKERHYTFNSAYLSEKALNFIRTQTFENIEKYLDGLVGTRFGSTQRLQEAQERLSTEFADGSGYDRSGKYVLNSGNRAVIGSYKDESKDYSVSVRLVFIENNKWVTREYRINDIQGELKDIDKSLQIVNDKISQYDNYIKSLQQSIDVISENDLQPSNGDFRVGPSGKAGIDWEEMSYKASQTARVVMWERKIEKMENSLVKLEKRKDYLEQRRTSVSKKEKIEEIK